MAVYEIWLANDRGERIELLDPFEFEFSRVLNGYGFGKFVVAFDEVLFNLVGVDYQVHVYRAWDGGQLSLYNAYLIRNKAATDFATHEQEMTFRGPDIRELLARRIVAFAADSSQALKTDNADDMMKAIVDENLGASAAAARDISGDGLSIQADSATGASITKAFAWKNVLTTLQQIADTSAIAGTPIYFDFALSVSDPVTGALAFEFQTFGDFADRDIRSSTIPGVAFSKEFGNLAMVHYEEDYVTEANYIYAGGQGTGAQREVVEVSDSDRINASIFNRRELFANASGASTTAGITGIANERLNDKRPRKIAHAELLDTDDTTFVKDWDVGSLVTVRAFGQSFDELIKAVSVQLGRNGAEQINARFEHGSFIGNAQERIISMLGDYGKRLGALETEDKERDDTTYNTFSDGDTTPSVSAGRLFVTANTGATSITTFDDGYDGQWIEVYVNDANTTFVDGATLILNGGGNFAAASGSTLSLRLRSSAWYEVGRNAQ